MSGSASLTAGEYKALGDRYAAASDFSRAGAAYLECLKRTPQNVGAALGMARAARELDKLDIAIRTLETALRFNPDDPALLGTLGAALEERRDTTRAIELLRRAIAIAPDDPGIAFNLANALRREGGFAEAEALYRRALARDPEDLDSLNNLAMAVGAQGRFGEAAGILEAALAHHPGEMDLTRYLLYVLACDPGVSAVQLLQRTRRAVGDAPQLRMAGRPAHGRPLRIGWLSSDLRDNTVAFNLLPLVQGMDPAGFQHCVYSCGRVRDATTAAFGKLASVWREVRGLSDDEVAELVRQDEVDILVILAARFSDNRVLFAARRAAPVQISFHDVATTGLANMDYFVGDPVIARRADEPFFTERLVRLPSYYVASPLVDMPDIGPVPMISAGGLTLACFNHPIKINTPVLELWSAILRDLPGARLLLGHGSNYRSQDVRDRIRAVFDRCGVARERVTMREEAQDEASFLAIFNQVDIALDPFPYSGSTTTFHSLWMGVPVVTRPGETSISRWTASILRALKLDTYVARNEREYVDIVKRVAAQPDSLAALRLSARERLRRSAFFNGALRGRQFGRLLRAIWRRHAAGVAARR